MRNSRCLARTTRFVPWIAAASLAMAGSALADGLLGIFFDPSAQNCAGDVPTAGSATLYLCFLPSGSASGGISGVEFRIDAGNGSYVFQRGPLLLPYPDAAMLGDPVAGGMNIAWNGCENGAAIAILQLSVLNPGGGAPDSEIRVVAKTRPSNPNFACPLVTLCNAPSFTTVCVDGTKTILNPSAPRPCGSGREQTEWSKVKSLYR